MTPAIRPALADLPPRFDLVVIGGGITGAGIFNEAASTGASVLLVERSDFGSGTSSWSSKLVHGGLRYLKSGQWRLTWESVRERNRLLRERAGLVERQPFLMPVYRGMKPGRAVLRAGLAIYDAMGGEMTSRSLTAEQTLALEPDLRQDDLLGAVAYDDARTDDARLVLRVILEACSARALALNRVTVEAIGRVSGQVRSVSLHDHVRDERREIEAGVVVTATGARGLAFPGEPIGAPTLRPLRGSHLIFPVACLPVRRAVSWLHPHDRRPIFAYPWEGAILVGTTDLDHDDAETSEPRISVEEVDYLMAGLAHQFPKRPLRVDDAISSFAGVRPIVAGGKSDPSAESRESASWHSDGWIGITGGKLTTFRVTARQVLQEAAKQVPALTPVKARIDTAAIAGTRLGARYGTAFEIWLRDDAATADRGAVEGSPYQWGELRWAARHEAVVHLDDLLLRRTRLGLLVPDGGARHLDRIGELCRDELGWDLDRWLGEREAYRSRWQRQHALPRPV